MALNRTPSSFFDSPLADSESRLASICCTQRQPQRRLDSRAQAVLGPKLNVARSSFAQRRTTDLVEVGATSRRQAMDKPIGPSPSLNTTKRLGHRTQYGGGRLPSESQLGYRMRIPTDDLDKVEKTSPRLQGREQAADTSASTSGKPARIFLAVEDVLSRQRPFVKAVLGLYCFLSCVVFSLAIYNQLYDRRPAAFITSDRSEYMRMYPHRSLVTRPYSASRPEPFTKPSDGSYSLKSNLVVSCPKCVGPLCSQGCRGTYWDNSLPLVNGSRHICNNIMGDSLDR